MAESVEIKSLSLDEALTLSKQLIAQKRYGEALKIASSALETGLILPQFMREAAIAAFYLGDLREAHTRARQALCYDPRDPANLLVISTILSAMGRQSECERYLLRALQIAPDMPALRWNRSLMLLQKGEFGPGFEEYDWGFVSGYRRPRFPWPAWAEPIYEREPLGGTFFVWAEQGLGDTLMMMRYLPRIAPHVQRLVVDVPEPLCSLVQYYLREYDHAHVYSADPSGTSPEAWDEHASFMDLPRICMINDIGDLDGSPYLHGFQRPARQSGRLRAVLATSGNPEHANDRNRTIPAEAARVLERAEGVEWTFINPGFEPPWKMESMKPVDFLHTAFMLETCDVVVTVDTALGHLAGAMGVPTLLMLGIPTDWRWHTGVYGCEDRSPWYEHHRIIRQHAPGDWAGVVDRTLAALEQMRQELVEEQNAGPETL